MKKLTAGIFATILGLTAVDAFAAVPTGRYNVASVKYVDEAMKAAQTAATYDDTALKGRLDAIEAEQLTQNTNITNAANAAANAATAAANAATAAANAETNAKAYTDAEIGEIGDMTVKAYVDAAQTAATYDDTALKGRLDAIEAEQLTQNTNITNAANAASAAATAAANAETNAKAYTDAEIGEIGDMTVKAYVDAAQTAATYDDTALKGRLDTIEAEQLTQNTNITNAANAASAADAKAVAAQGEVDALEEVVATKANASDLTGYVAWTDVDDTYVENEYTF